jgi:glutathione S-transferase
MAIKLYDLVGAEDDRRFSPNCWRTAMALKHKGLEFESVPWRFTERDAIAFSGQGLVPVLVDGNHTVHDSWNIALYLEEAYPQRPALFEGKESQALTFFFQQWVFRAIHSATLKVIVLDLFARLHEKDKAYFRESREKRFGMTLEAYAGDKNASLAAFRGALEPVRPVLVQHPFVSGKGPGYADYLLLGPFMWARAMSPVRMLEPDDPVFGWRERMLDLWGGYARSAKGFPVWA